MCPYTHTTHAPHTALECARAWPRKEDDGVDGFERTQRRREEGRGCHFTVRASRGQSMGVGVEGEGLSVPACEHPPRYRRMWVRQ